METTISEAAKRCLAQFLGILGHEDGWNRGQVHISDVQDELSRFKVWVGNAGAQHSGKRSLDYRLRDASHLSLQVLQLLGNMGELLDSARNILTGKQMPWDEEPTDSDFDSHDASSDSDFSSGMPKTELAQIIRNIGNIVTCLARLAVAIRNPAPHDRFRKSQAIDTSYAEPYDIQHVRNKFSSIDDHISERLGKSISRRRQYFKYREAHHARLSEGLQADSNKTETTAKSTVSSSIPDALKKNKGFDVWALGDDADSDTGLSRTSYADSTVNEDGIRIPPLPKEAQKGPFECPYCYSMIVARTRSAWKKHVFRDLRPYVCLYKDCAAPDQDFDRRHEWMEHVRQHHWRIWECQASMCRDTFGSAYSCRNHLAKAHRGLFSLSQIDAAVKMCEREKNMGTNLMCPICNKKVKSVKEYWRHVGGEQEQLSLFALPKEWIDDTGEDEDDDNEGEDEDKGEDEDEDEDESESESEDDDNDAANAQPDKLLDVSGSRPLSFDDEYNPNFDDTSKDDILYLQIGHQRVRGVFPADSIIDGKLYTTDVVKRVQLIKDIFDSKAKSIKLFHKKQQLEILDEPIFLQGVEHGSTIDVEYDSET